MAERVDSLLTSSAAMVELVDTLDSKSDVLRDVPVQVRLAVPDINKPADAKHQHRKNHTTKLALTASSGFFGLHSQ